jgi:hypothetical protein
MTRRRPRGDDRPARLPDAASIDRRYGLEPVFEPGRERSGLGEFVTVDCPYCGERFATPLDLSAGAYAAIEDCQVCCRPIEIAVAVDDAGALAAVEARRID